MINFNFKKITLGLLALTLIQGCDYINDFIPLNKDKVLTCNITSDRDGRIIVNNEAFINYDRKVAYEGKVETDKFILKAQIPYVSIVNFNKFTFTTLRGGIVMGEKLGKDTPYAGKQIDPEFEINLKDEEGIHINNNYILVDKNKLIIEKELPYSRIDIPVELKNVRGNARFIINKRIFKLCDGTLCVGTKPPKVVKNKVELETVVDLASTNPKTLDVKFDLGKKEIERFIYKNWSIGKVYTVILSGSNPQGDSVKIRIESKSGKVNKEDQVKLKEGYFKYEIRSMKPDEYTIKLNEKTVQIKFI